MTNSCPSRARDAGREFLHHLIKGEGGGLLPRWKLFERLQKRSHGGLRGHEQIDMVEEPVVMGLRCDAGAFERVGAQIVELRHAQRDKRLGPDPQCAGGALLHEYELPVVVTQAGELPSAGEIKKL